MKPVLIACLCVSAALGGCTTMPPSSAYDIVAAEFGPDASSRCERYAYESGRNRYETLAKVMGQAFASTNANRIAREAFARCASGRSLS